MKHAGGIQNSYLKHLGLIRHYILKEKSRNEKQTAAAS